ncbi:MAG: response regulator transcription factor [Acidobacteriota bacterium]|nr:response regulator transcription factor [Acidobacteriota bacterium]
MARAHRLLMIDDDTELTALLQEYFRRFGHHLRVAAHAAEGLRMFRQERPDLLILDVMLPGKDGMTLCREIRARDAVPIIMLTARGEVTDRIVGLELGADDYIPKPFEPRELVARIETVLRRVSPGGDAETLTHGDLSLEPNSFRAALAGEDLELTSTEFALLRMLMERPGRVMSREILLQELRGADAEIFDRSIDMLISRLRHKLGEDSRSPRYIKTIRGAGYLFAG